MMLFFFSQSENPTSVLIVGGATSSVALLRSTKRDVTTTSSAWGCRTASTQVGASQDIHFHPNLMAYFTQSAGLTMHATAVYHGDNVAITKCSNRSG